jgi:hypothetical protein
MGKIDDVEVSIASFKKYVNQVDLKKIHRNEMEVGKLKVQNQKLSQQVLQMTHAFQILNAKINHLECQPIQRSRAPSLPTPWNTPQDTNAPSPVHEEEVLEFALPSPAQFGNKEFSFDLSTPQQHKTNMVEEPLPLPVSDEIEEEEFSIEDVARMAAM